LIYVEGRGQAAVLRQRALRRELVAPPPLIFPRIVTLATLADSSLPSETPFLAVFCWRMALHFERSSARAGTGSPEPTLPALNDFSD
jgi:hypothetical protein